MDALMAALVAAALAQIGDRPAWLAAILADRYRTPFLVTLAAMMALIAASGLAAAAGAALAPMLTPAARQALLALALILQGGGATLPVKAPDRLQGWRLGAFATSVAGLFILAFGDGLQFVLLALAARSAPWLAATGGVIGSMVVLAPAVILGEQVWTRLPLRPIRMGVAVLFLLTGATLGLGALRLI